MRPDVKLGVVISAVVVLVAGSYYLYRDRSDKPIPLNNGNGGLSGSLRSTAPLNGTTKLPGDKPIAPGKNAGHGVSATKPKTISSPPTSVADKKAPNRSRMSGLRKPAASGRRRKMTESTRTPSRRPVTRQPHVKSIRRAKPATQQFTTNPPEQTPGMKLATRERIQTDGGRRISTPRGTGNKSQRKTGVPLTGLAAGSPVGLAGRDHQAAAIDSHRAQQGDTLASLSMRYYGSRDYVPVLARANPHLNQTGRIRSGTIVRIPPRPENVGKNTAGQSDRASTPRTSSPSPVGNGTRTSGPVATRRYRVKTGDSLYSIAKQVLGNGGRWKELYELNRATIGNDPSRIKIGQQLILPNS